MSELVPKLRFGGFVSDWKESCLDTLCANFKSGSTITSATITSNGDYPVYGGNGLRGFTSTYTHDGDYVLIGRQGALCGNINECSGKSFISEHAIVIGENDYSDIKWLKYKLDYMELNRYSESSAQPGLSVGRLKRLKVFHPSKQEQQKIADFLTSVDTKISQLTEKHRLLKEYKKGVMQQIFSQKIRFKDENGEAFPEWEVSTFGQLFNWIRTNNLSREKLTSTETKIQNIHYGDIHMRFPALFAQDKELVPYVVEEEQDKLISQADFCQVGDLVIADASEDYADIGKAIEIISVKNNTLVAGLHTYIARPIKEFASGYIGYLFQFNDTRNQIKKLAQGVSVLGLSKTNLETVELPIPCITEQQKIALYLQAIDAKINAVNQQIEDTKLFKKGLLQQMFV
ncbi:restriction endonuclease subunit S [Vibrio aphrogenes]|uniref:restriction endonuclease subunit S n=1 Tax=Vibrio aphrogenes TaxID=1891186 RepID=UPI000B351D85|nr:restriction endonuclease subunit S [Vibrio aphrogenes]